MNQTNNPTDSSDEALSVSACGKGVTTNDLTADSQGTYCDLAENSLSSQNIISQDLFESQSSISILECSNPSSSSKKHGFLKNSSLTREFSKTISSTPLAKRKRGENNSSDSSSQNGNRKKSKIQSGNGSSNIDEGPADQTILLTSGSGVDSSQLNFSQQLDTQLKLPNSLEDVAAGDTQSLSISNESSQMSQKKNQHNDGSQTNEDQKNVTVKTKICTGVMVIEERWCINKNTVLSVHIKEVGIHSDVQSILSADQKTTSKESLSSGSVFSMPDGPFLIKALPFSQRMSTSSSSTCASSAAALAFKTHYQKKLILKDSSIPVQCSNCNYTFKNVQIPAPAIATPDLITSSEVENISSSCEEGHHHLRNVALLHSSDGSAQHSAIKEEKEGEEDEKGDDKDTSDVNKEEPVILQATRRSSYNKQFSTLETLEQIKPKSSPIKPSPVKTFETTPSKPKGRPTKYVPKGRRKKNLTFKIESKTIQHEESKTNGESEDAELSQPKDTKNKGKGKKIKSLDKDDKTNKDKITKEAKSNTGCVKDQHTAQDKSAPMVMNRNVYDSGKKVLAMWKDKIYYPAIIEEDLQSFLRVKYLDGFRKKIIKQQTIPMSILFEDTPVHIIQEDNEEEDSDVLTEAKLKELNEENSMCTVELLEQGTVVSIPLSNVRMLSQHVKVIQNKYTDVLESPKLHQFTLDNVLQRKRTPARRTDIITQSKSSSTSVSSPKRKMSKLEQSSSQTSATTLEPISNPSDGGSTSSNTKSPSSKRSTKEKSSIKKNVLEEKYENNLNTSIRCTQRILSDEDHVTKNKEKPPCKKRKKNYKKLQKNDRQSPEPCSSKGSTCSDKPRPTYHGDIEIVEYYPSSDSENEFFNIDLCGENMEYVNTEYYNGKNEVTAGSSKSKDVNKICGPIPDEKHDLFSGYVFVVSHSLETNEYLCDSSNQSGDEQYNKMINKFPFKRSRLEQQLTKGGGTVYPSLNHVPQKELNNCLLVTDRPNKTCNFILALAMRIPVLFYYYVIECCTKKIHIKTYRLPDMSSGYSLEQKRFLNRNLTTINIMGDYIIVVAMNANLETKTFWEKVLKFAGATVKFWTTNFDWHSVNFYRDSMTIAILVNDMVPEDVEEQDFDKITPEWIIQSLIHAEARRFDAHPSYKYESKDTRKTSETF